MAKSKVVKNYIYNTAYDLLRILSPLITTPYISRVLGSGGVGIYSYARSYATFFILLGTLGTGLYGQREIAYVQDDKEKRSKVFWEIETFRLLFTLLGTLAFFLIFGNHGENAIIYRILTLEVLANAIDISWFFQGIENFKLTVIRNSIIKIAGIVFVFAFVKKPEDVPLFTWCLVLPYFIANLSLWPSMRKYLCNTSFSFTDSLKRHMKPVMILFLPQVAAEVYEVLDKAMIGAISKDMDQVGCYTQSQKLIRIILLIVTSLGTVMLSAMSAAFARGDKERIEQSIKKAFRFVFMISVALMFGLCALTERFVPFFLGSGFDLVGPITIVTSPILVVIGISNVIGKQYLLPTMQQEAYTKAVMIGAGVNVVFNFFLISQFGAIGAAIATVVAELTVMGVEMYFVRGQLPLGACLMPLIRYLIMGVIMFAAVAGVGKVLPSGSVYMLVMIAAGVLVYGLELLITRDEMLMVGIDLVKRKMKW
jgi:O-antigen/teichoic acid export membrane protein